MWNGTLIFTLVAMLMPGSVVYATPEVSPRPEVQENVRQLQEKNSCPGCDLAGAILHRGNFIGADLEGANLAGAQLNLANLAGANLRNANLQGASFGGADLAGADLTGANLTGAVIEGAYLAGAKMDGQVVVRKPYVEEGGPQVGETVVEGAAGKSKSLPFTNQATVMAQNVPADTVLSPEKVEPVETAVPASASAGSERPAGDMPADPLPDKSKQLKKMNEAVVVAEAPLPEYSVPVAEKAVQESTREDIPLPVEEKGVTPAVEPEEVLETAMEGEREAGKDEPVENVMAEPVENVMPEPVENVMSEPAADPEAERRKMLVEKLLDDNRCVACDLSGVDLSDRDLEDADLERVILKGANLREVDLEGANLKGADMSGADLRDADLREADMYRADVSGADLTGAKLEGALVDSLIHTDTVGADFKGAIGME